MNDSDATTKPTLETILERLDDIRRENADFRKSAEEKFDNLIRENADFRKSTETRLDGFEYRLDNIEKQFSLSHAAVIDVKMELRELRNQLKEHLPALK